MSRAAAGRPAGGRAAPAAAFHALTDVGARAAYAGLLAASPQRSPFSGLPFADAACAAYGFAGSLLLVGEDAGLVVFEKRRGGLRAAALPPYARFVTPVLRAAPDPAAVHEHRSPLDALTRALGARTHQATLYTHPTLHDLRPFAWAGWAVAPTFHMAAPIRGDDGQGAWSRSPRKWARRNRGDYEVREGRDWIGPVVGLAVRSMEAKRLGHPDARAVASVAEALVDAGQARAYVALPAAGGPPDAGLVLLLDEPTAFYSVVGSTPGPAMSVLMAHVVSELQQAGYTRLYLGGANVPSVAEFKRQLGGELVTAFRVRHVRGRLLRLREALAGR